MIFGQTFVIRLQSTGKLYTSIVLMSSIQEAQLKWLHTRKREILPRKLDDIFIVANISNI